MSLDQLNGQFGIDGNIRFVEGQGGMPCIEISNRAAQATISLHGGQVLSYRPVDANHDLLFLSEHAIFKADKAIKGGIPICWPWFGDDPEGRGRQAHGFARNMPWTVSHTAQSGPGHTKIELALEDNAATQALWPHTFRLTLHVDIADTLTLALVTRNTGETPLRITQALHSYFSVGDIDTVSVNGLDGLRYLDKVRQFVEDRQQGPVTFTAEVDRIYQGVNKDLSIDDPSLQRSIHIQAGNSTTAVVWNPWVDIAQAMQDLADDAYRRFVCVETANAADEVISVAPSTEYRLTVNYRIEARSD